MPDNLLMPEGSDPYYGQKYSQDMNNLLMQRASVLPLAEYANGRVGPAVPGMLMDGWNAFWNAGDAASRGDWQGAGHAGAEAAGMAMVGSMPFAQRNAVGIFGGRLAKTADHAALAKAEEMTAHGFARNDIRQATGWFKDAGDNWRFTIPDAPAVATGQTGTLGKALDHSALFEAYPQLQSMPVKPLPANAPAAAQGSYLPRVENAGLLRRWLGAADPEISIAPSASKPSLLHETQHAVDDIEGALRGLDKANPYGVKVTSADSAAYMDAPFEKMARATAARADMTEAQLAERAPWLDYGESRPGQPRDQALPPVAPKSVQWAEGQGGLPMMPELQAIQDTFRDAYGRELNGTHWRGKVFTDYMKGHYNNPDGIAAQNMIRDFADTSLKEGGNPKQKAFVEAFDAYREKAQRMGHNGGPDPKTWESDPFLYSMKEGSGPQMSAEPPPGIRAYHGSPQDTVPGMASGIARASTGQPLEVEVYRGSLSNEAKPRHLDPYWATTDYDIANHYGSTYDVRGIEAQIAKHGKDSLDPTSAEMYREASRARPNVSRGIAKFENPLVVDAQGNGWSEVRHPPTPGERPIRWDTDELADHAADMGHDGLIVRNVYDEGSHTTNVIAAVKPNTVRSYYSPDKMLYGSAGLGASGMLMGDDSGAPPKAGAADIISIVKKYGIAAAASMYGMDAVNNAMGASEDKPANLLMQGY
mgnify:CR=1 FL=1